jgi:hypothetical protein
MSFHERHAALSGFCLADGSIIIQDVPFPDLIYHKSCQSLLELIFIPNLISIELASIQGVNRRCL